MIDTGMPRNAPTFVRGEQNDDGRPSPVNSSHQASARLLKRIANGFGMANTEKFAGFSTEVLAACEGYGPVTIDAAADMLVRGKRPDIGMVYGALEAAANRLRPVNGAQSDQRVTEPQRSDVNDLTLVVAWLCGGKVRFHDWQAEFGPPSPFESPFVSEAKLKQFALNAAAQQKRDVDLLFYIVAHRSERPRGLGEELARRIEHALLKDRAGVEARRKAFDEASGEDAGADDAADLVSASAAHYGYVD